jgi:hypothetical protein
MAQKKMPTAVPVEVVELCRFKVEGNGIYLEDQEEKYS